ncbi:galactokinase [bacterium]|nr:galactokinase [bacterium]
MNLPDNKLVALYGADSLESQRQRYRDLTREYSERFGVPQLLQFVSAPGRTELGGNHTDHNQGRVLCAAVRRDAVAAVEPRSDDLAKLKSSAFPQPYEIDLSDPDPKNGEKGTPAALIRGVAAGLKKRGFQIGGFNAVIHSDVGIGSGLSSSASFEVLTGGIFNTLFNENRVDPVTLAKIGQYAENVYFGKPCGLMDQLASSIGGVLAIDFKDSENPVIEKVPVDFSQTDYILAVVDTGGSHADLTSAYASIPNEMKQVASLFGKNTLREVGEETFRAAISRIRPEAGDRAVLRSLHFFVENRRVVMMVEALKTKDYDTYLRLAAESGASSNSMLQNIVAPDSIGHNQPAALAIGVSNDFFRSRGRGVARIHGGGFAGTIQAYAHRDDFKDYSQRMHAIFGSDCIQPLTIRTQGVVEIR